jgi:hypothetical protein
MENFSAQKLMREMYPVLIGGRVTRKGLSPLVPTPDLDRWNRKKLNGILKNLVAGKAPYPKEIFR